MNIGQRVENIKTHATGTVTGNISYRRNAGRSLKEIPVKWDVPNDAGMDEWKILVRNLKAI